MVITCKTGQDNYKTYLQGLSANLSYFAEPLPPVATGTFPHRVEFKPEFAPSEVAARVGIAGAAQ